jgi:TRAP-type C4-dicarboxylate transport system permease small subunit
VRLKAIKTELLWLLSCYVLVLGIYRIMAGSWRFWQGTLDIQMHNTYFVFSNVHVTVLLFLLVALVVTSARAIAAPLRTRYTWVVLLLLGTPFLLGILLIISIKKKLTG